MNQEEYEVYEGPASSEKKDQDVSENHEEHHEKSHRFGFWKGLFAGIAVTAVAFLVILLFVASPENESSNTASGSGNSVSTQELTSGLDSILDADTLDKMDYIYTLIRLYYFHDYAEEDVKDGILSGLVDGLGDVYSEYYNKEDTKLFTESTSGQFSGIGVVLQQDTETNLVTVVTVYEDSPAEKAGIKKNDVLYKVDGEDITAEELSIIVTKVKGLEGTDVELTFYRDGKEFTTTCTRAQITVDTVVSEMLDGKIGYIQVSGFEEVTDTQFSERLADLKEQGMESLIIDLRDNPGGDVDVTVNMLDELLPEGMAVYMMDKTGERTDYETTGTDELGIPLVILVNGNSASASEIFTGCVKDRNIATVVGTQTYGKGVVQSVIDLGDETMLKLTIAEYYTPSGVCIDGVGITPDVIVEAGEDENQDPQLDKAIEILKEEQ